MNILLKAIVLSALVISCKNKETEIIEPPPITLGDSIKEKVEPTAEQHKQKDEVMLMEQETTVQYKKNGIEGIIFTKKYYKNNPNNFTPTKQQIDRVEELISQEPEDFSIYYRQYDGVKYNGHEIIDIQLIPKAWIERGDHKEWREHRIAITNLTISYDLNSKILSVPQKGINH